MSLSVREQPADSSRQDILNAAAHCFHQRGYAATSIDDVARRLGATKGRIYHHFPSKADLFAGVVRLGMDLNFAAIEPLKSSDGRAVDRWRAMACVHVREMIARRAFQRAVWEGVEMHLRGATTPQQRQEMEQLIDYRTRYGDLFRSEIEQARADGDFAFENLSIANQLMFMTLNSPIFWYSPRQGESDTETGNIVRQVVRFAYLGLGGREG